MINFLKNRILLIFVILAVLVVAAGVALEAYRNSNLASKITVSNIEINNVSQSPIEKNNEGDFVFERDDDFEIAYLKDNDSFYIVIMNPDFESARIKAENSFLKQLGIEKSEACKLNVKLFTPDYVNEELSVFEYGLSFCNN